MVRTKVTVTLDRAKAERARALGCLKTTSEVLDAALDRYIYTEQLRHDITAYQAVPQSEEEIALAELDPVLLED